MSKDDTQTTHKPADGEISVPLQTPIQRGTQRIDTVVLRRPKAGQLRGLLLTDLLQMRVDSLAALLPRITTPTLLQHEIDDLDPADLVALSGAAIGFFLARSQSEQISTSPTG